MVWRTLAAHTHASNLPKRHVMRVRRVEKMELQHVWCGAHWQLTTMLATSAMRLRALVP